MTVSRFSILLSLLFFILPAAATTPVIYNELPSYLQPFQDTVEEQARCYPHIFFLSALHGEKMVALTFDDGPGPFTPQILHILAQHNLPATFFVLGEGLEEYSHILLRILEEGHTLGNHSWSHPDFRYLSSLEVLQEEIIPTSSLLQELTGLYPLLIRPPYGAILDETIAILGAEGYSIINWSLDSFDWDRTQGTKGEILEKILDYHHPGAIILMHDGGEGREEVVAALPHLIKALQERGYGFQTVDALLGITPYR